MASVDINFEKAAQLSLEKGLSRHDCHAFSLSTAMAAARTAAHVKDVEIHPDDGPRSRSIKFALAFRDRSTDIHLIRHFKPFSGLRFKMRAKKHTRLVLMLPQQAQQARDLLLQSAMTPRCTRNKAIRKQNLRRQQGYDLSLNGLSVDYFLILIEGPRPNRRW